MLNRGNPKAFMLVIDMLATPFCFYQANLCAYRADAERDETRRRFLRHLQNSWLAAATRSNERKSKPAEVVRLKRCLKIVIR